MQYRTAQEAVELIQSNQSVFIHSAAATPRDLVYALSERSSVLQNVSLYSIHTEWEAKYALPQHE